MFEYTATNDLDNQIYGSYRWGTACGANQQVLPGAGYPPAGAPAIDWAADYHVFGMTWSPTNITFYVDGVAYETVTGSEAVLAGSEAAVAADALPWAPAAHEARALRQRQRRRHGWSGQAAPAVAAASVSAASGDPSGVLLPTSPQYTIIDAAIAWYWPPGDAAAYPAVTYFDWVRVFQWSDASAAGVVQVDSTSGGEADSGAVLPPGHLPPPAAAPTA